MGTTCRVRSTRPILVTTLAFLLLLAACTSDNGGDSASTPPEESTPSEPVSDDDKPPALTGPAVEASFAELDTIVETGMAETGVPGVAVAVVYDDEVMYTQGYGVRDVDTGDPVDSETIFLVASLTKSISSTIMAGAVGQGIFAWNDPVSKYNPEFELSSEYVTENVTFADLFSHRSGIPGGGGDVLEAIGYDRSEVLRRLRYLQLNPFRDTYAYSNFAMTAGGESAAVAANRSWEDLADEILFDPLGMTSTSMRFADFDEADNRAELHVKIDDSWESAFSRMPDAQAPAGGVNSNIIDLAIWMRLQLAAGQLGGEQIIDEEALNMTHTPMIARSPPLPDITGVPRSYGLGWNVEVDATGATRWNHSGAFSTGAATTVKLLPAEGLGIVVLTNGAPVGLPEAITDAYFDLLQTGEWSADTFDIWLDRFSGIYGEPEEFDDPGDDAVPALGNDAYLGLHANDYVGEVQVVERDGNLVVIAGPAEVEYELTHLDGNTFTYVQDPELPDFLSGAIFEFGSDEGPANSLTLTGFDVDGLGTLERIGDVND
jgi:CubicO group peptidase (beta-lactamase class C family)